MPYFDEGGKEIEEDWVRSSVLELRGGCGCGWPNASPPCWQCTEPPSYDELCALEVEWREEPPPIDYFKAVRDLCR